LQCLPRRHGTSFRDHQGVRCPKSPGSGVLASSRWSTTLTGRLGQLHRDQVACARAMPLRARFARRPRLFHFSRGRGSIQAYPLRCARFQPEGRSLVRGTVSAHPRYIQPGHSGRRGHRDVDDGRIRQSNSVQVSQVRPRKNKRWISSNSAFVRRLALIVFFHAAVATLVDPPDASGCGAS
jgi:hypothetical protein